MVDIQVFVLKHRETSWDGEVTDTKIADGFVASSGAVALQFTEPNRDEWLNSLDDLKTTYADGETVIEFGHVSWGTSTTLKSIGVDFKAPQAVSA